MDEELWVSEHGPSTKMGSLVLTGGTMQLIGGVSTYKTPRVGAAGRGVFTQTGGNLYMNLGEFRMSYCQELCLEVLDQAAFCRTPSVNTFPSRTRAIW